MGKWTKTRKPCSTGTVQTLKNVGSLPDWKVCKLRNPYHFFLKFCRRIFVFARRRDILRVQFLPFSLAPQLWLYTSHVFLLLAFLSRFSMRFIVQYFVRCENVHLHSGSYIFKILHVSTRILSEIVQPRSRLHSTNFPVWVHCLCCCKIGALKSRLITPNCCAKLIFEINMCQKLALIINVQ